MQIGIVSTGIFLPENYITGAEIAQLAGIPERVVGEKMGIKKKPVPGPGDHTCEMGIKAARVALEKANMDPLTSILSSILARNTRSIHYGQPESSCRRKSVQGMPGPSILPKVWNDCDGSETRKRDDAL